MEPNQIQSAADYADALATARRAKNWLVALILASLLLQIAVFFTARYSILLNDHDKSPNRLIYDFLHFLTAAIAYLAVILSIALCAILLLLTNVMLVGRLIGVARTTSAFAWSILLALLLFPWQSIFFNPQSTAFQIPGIIYHWQELVETARFGFDTPPTPEFLILKWTRFVGFPAIAIAILLFVQANTSRAIRLALGESRDTPPISPSKSADSPT